LIYVKKTTGGGQIDPPPAGIGLSTKKELFHLYAIYEDLENIQSVAIEVFRNNWFMKPVVKNKI